MPHQSVQSVDKVPRPFGSDSKFLASVSSCDSFRLARGQPHQM